MKMLRAAVVLFVLVVSTDAGVQPSPLTKVKDLPLTLDEVKNLPRDSHRWITLWKERELYDVERIVVRANGERGFSVFLAKRNGSDFSEYILVPPGEEPRVGTRVRTKWVRFFLEDGTKGPVIPFLREPLPEDSP